ncbi:hypothetical protein Tco_0599330 [Tanacetum coccineum]
MEPGGSISSNLVDKIRNIDGKIIKEGKLRSAMRGVVKVGSYVESLDGRLHAKDSGLPSNKTMPPINEDASEIFGEPAASVNVVEDNMVNQDTTTKSTAFTFSFANILNRNSNPNKKIVKIQELRNPERVDGAAVAIPMEAVEEVSSRFSNTLYGYFIGKRLAFPLVENYVKNTWAKFGLKRTQLHEDFFMFQFNTNEGMESVMESGPWLVRGVPLILNIWNQNSELKKDAIKSAPLWVKLHHVPIVAYSEIGLSLITTQLGKPIMLDSYTSNMCLSSWGRNTYARALVEFSAEEELKDSIVIAILLINGKGHTLAKIDVEYEWNPPRCNTCKVFDHVNDKCPKNPKVDAPTKAVNDGFTVVDKDVMAKKSDILNAKPAQQPLIPKPILKKPNEPVVSTKNSFGALNVEEELEKNISNIVNDDSDDEEMDETIVFDDRQKKGASTPVISKNNLSVFAILESHVVKSNLMKMCSLVFRHWDWTSNGAWCSKGTRIILSWNHNEVDVAIINQNDQAVHSRLWLKKEKKEIFCTFVYAHNKYNQRRDLWNALCLHKVFVNNRPWCLLGDFNATLHLSESTASSSCIDIAMREFKDCVNNIEVLDVQNTGLQFTWNQKPKGTDGILKKLDRVMANMTFVNDFAGSHAIFKPYRNSDHSPSVLCIPTATKVKPKPFKFFNVLIKHDRFKEVVNEAWNYHVSGFYMFRTVKKLKNLKKPLRKLMIDKGNLHANVERIRGELDTIQTQLDTDPFNIRLCEIEAANVVAFNQVVLDEEMFLKQKAKISWLKDGDSNTALPQVEKSPVPDGFSAAFFKEAWHIVGVDVINAIREFFTNGLFRVVTLAFVLGRSIADNILLTQELMHNYHLDRGPSRCAFKVDIQKAYDTVDWAFLNSVLMGFGFHERMIAWIMECVSSTSYSICINGNLHGYFQGKRGLRQGDPLSPYLFTLVMEVLTLMFKRKVMDSDCFSFHRYCDKLELINLCFADDLFIFAYGDVQSVVVIKECLDEFKHASGLIPSIPKSTAFFCNVLNHVKLSILNVLPFEEGRLPVKYLGVPLVSSRLKARDCKELVEKVQNRVLDWKNKALSIAGRLQLIRSVISSMHVFWASVFVIPNRVLMDIEQCMRNFLWCPSSSSKGKAKVAWELVCLPKDEGGLGIRRLELFNSALLVSHIWNLLSSKESLWVKWVHAYKLNGRNFWDVPIRGNMSWSWRKILQLRPSIRDFIWRKIGNGSSTSIWFDKWCHEGPLASRVSPRDIHRAGLTLYSHVGDIIRDGDWVWPRVLLDKYQFLNECTVPLSNNCDTLEWRLYDGKVKRFSVAQVWECIRPRANKVLWVDLIWFAMGIPRHAFNLWLIINHKLKTQDRVSIWDYSNVLGSTCPLCEATPDSHEHLFFICPFANSVWSRMKVKVVWVGVSHNILICRSYGVLQDEKRK